MGLTAGLIRSFIDVSQVLNSERRRLASLRRCAAGCGRAGLVAGAVRRLASQGL